MQEKSKVILLGGSHHNGLGLARSFGVNGIAPFGIIIGSGADKSFIRKSKYWAKTWAVNSVEEAIELMLYEFKDEASKPVIIPWSDSVAIEIDKNLNKLKDYFIVPSLNNEQGAIVKLMNKYEQIEFAKKHNLPMAKSWIIGIDSQQLPIDITYPCIFKPVTSAEGNKSDIKMCTAEETACEYLVALKQKGYTRILLQEFINFDYEYEFIGCCGSDDSYLISRNIRQWPLIGGTNSFFQCLSESSIISICDDILKALQDEGYFGLFDIEMFYIGSKVYLNEINWRNSGNSFFALGTNVHYAVIWYLSAIGESTKHLKHFCTDVNQFAMNEATDLRHVIFGKLSLNYWFKCRNKTQSFAVWFKGDLKPTIAQYIYLAKTLIMGKKK